jgi:UDP-N-acetylmuramoyl-tripeptide--D-alanyl-D-alanine ligase
MTPLWDSAALCAATGGRLTAEASVTGVSIDSRSVCRGELFVALRDSRDGHDFVADAMGRGAAAAMVDRTPPGLAAGAALLQVSDTLAGLRALGAAGRARSAARVIGVTGSVGKTTTKEMLRSALTALAPTHASVASYNNHWGVPLTLARLPPSAAYAVIEMGMNNRHEIAPLARLARPHIAIVTAIASNHVGHLGSLAAIAEEKADIVLGLEPGGVAVMPGDGPFAALLAERSRAAGARLLRFGETAGVDIRLLGYAGEPDGGIAEIDLAGERLHLRIGAPGRHMAMNACAALGAIHAAGGDARRAAAALAGFGAGAGRGQRVTLHLAGGEALLLDDSYNASTASVRAGLAVLAAQPARRRLVVLGDMRELGEAGPAMHAALAADVAAAADLVFCCGALMRHLHDALPAARQGAHAGDSAALAPLVAQALRPGDAVLVKGSLGSRMAVIVAALKAAGAMPETREKVPS